MAGLHDWWQRFGRPLEDVASGGVDRAREMAALTSAASMPGVTFVEARRTDDASHVALHLEIEVKRPQDLAFDIRAVEPVAVIFDAAGRQPSVLALRAEFPDTMHQNAVPAGLAGSNATERRGDPRVTRRAWP